MYLKQTAFTFNVNNSYDREKLSETSDDTTGLSFQLQSLRVCTSFHCVTCQGAGSAKVYEFHQL
jgi:hypothetical protein